MSSMLSCTATRAASRRCLAAGIPAPTKTALSHVPLQQCPRASSVLPFLYPVRHGSKRSVSTSTTTTPPPAASFSSSAPARAIHRVEVVPSAPQTLGLRLASPFTAPPFPHPVYTPDQVDAIKIAHRNTRSVSDWVALTAVRVLRWGFDMATGYRHDKAVALGQRSPEEAVQKYAMSEDKWLTRFIFLESIAGVPGMVGGMVRHLQSLRCLRRDHGWIETLLEEAENERMHLLTFLAFEKPGWFMRLMILGAQGVFTNFFFFSYLLSPRTCHRFVGYLEEEAVITYTRAISDLEAGKLPKWEKMQAPEIARDYFKMSEDATVKDLLKVIRADECKHREVNHTLANLDGVKDFNPYVVRWEGEGPRPTKSLETVKSTGWEREELGGIEGKVGAS